MSSSPSEEKYEELEFTWLRRSGFGHNRSVKFYKSFSYDGLEYYLHDCVYMHKQDELPYIGKLVKIWEKADTTKKVKVQWFFRPSEISCYLKDVEVLDNELFLASGEGSGILNVNPLEAIAGKCNVVCISTDKRNPQPSVEQRQTADYVFYRTFDVRSLTISDKMNDDVGGLDVKYIFNKRESDRAIEGTESGETRTIVGKNTTMTSKALRLYEYSNHMMETEGTNVKEVHEKTENLVLETKGVLFSGKALTRQNRSSVHLNLGKANEVRSGDEQLKDLGSNIVECKIIEVEDVKAPVTQFQVEESMITAKKSNNLDDKPSKRMKMDHYAMSVKDKGINDAQKMIVPGMGNISLSSQPISSGTQPKTMPVNRSTSEARPPYSEIKKAKIEARPPSSETKNVPTLGTSKEENVKSRLNKEIGGLEKVSSMEYCKENSGKILHGNSSKSPIATNKGNDAKVCTTFEVTRRPVAEKSTWFKELPWDQRVKSSHDEGTLVLLRNLDPKYTSGEVEEIICHALEETCAARMVQHTAISNPFYGQAFAIFKTREAAERVVNKLDDRCLMLPNNRPLKDAVSTSHYSQTNTIEYEMAMFWSLLQSRSEKWWYTLYEQQKVSLENLRSNLKTKQASA